jgi:hypothetical protein
MRYTAKIVKIKVMDICVALTIQFTDEIGKFFIPPDYSPLIISLDSFTNLSESDAILFLNNEILRYLKQRLNAKMEINTSTELWNRNSTFLNKEFTLSI